jgi:hypothetical protein
MLVVRLIDLCLRARAAGFRIVSRRLKIDSMYSLRLAWRSLQS